MYGLSNTEVKHIEKLVKHNIINIKGNIISRIYSQT